MPRNARYSKALLAQVLTLANGVRKDASPDGYFYPADDNEEELLLNAGATADQRYNFGLNGTEPSTIYVGAYDTVGKAGLDYLCTASNAVSVWNKIIARVRGKPTRIIVRTGTYNFDDNVAVDTSWLSIEGEFPGFWRKYDPNAAGQSGSAFAFPRSFPGDPCGSQFRQLTQNKGIFTVGTNYFNNDTRHKGLRFKDLSFYSAFTSASVATAGAACPIYDNADTDICRIQGCNIQGFATGINVAWDNPLIFDNNIQDTAGSGSGNAIYAAIVVRGYRGSLYGNVVFQVAGNGMWIGSNGCSVSNNVIGMPNDNGILVTNRDVSIVGNIIASIGRNTSNTSDGIVIGNYNTAPTADGGNKFKTKAYGTKIIGNSIEMNLDDAANSNANNGNGIRVGGDGGAGGSECNHTIIGLNYISRGGSTNAAAAGCGVQLRNTSDYCIVGLNSINQGLWNQAIDGGAGTHNQISLNAVL